MDKDKNKEIEREMYILCFSILIACAIGSLLTLGVRLDFSGGITGFAVAEGGEEVLEALNPEAEATQETDETTKKQITESEADIALKQAESDKLEMQRSNFTTTYINDTLERAKEIFNDPEAARKYKTYTGKRVQNRFELVIELTEEITQKKAWAFEVYDKLTALNSKLEEYESKGFDVIKIKNISAEAHDHFDGERYVAAEQAIDKANELAEVAKSEQTAIKAMAEASRTFLQKYWAYIIVIILALMPIIWFSQRRIKVWLLKNKIIHLKTEQESLQKLIKQAQIDRFEKNKIPERVYKIRTDKYSSRTEEIKSTLPVLEAQLDKLLMRKKRPAKPKKKEKKGVVEVK